MSFMFYFFMAIFFKVLFPEDLIFNNIVKLLVSG